MEKKSQSQCSETAISMNFIFHDFSVFFQYFGGSRPLQRQSTAVGAPLLDSGICAYKLCLRMKSQDRFKSSPVPLFFFVIQKAIVFLNIVILSKNKDLLSIKFNVLYLFFLTNSKPDNCSFKQTKRFSSNSVVKSLRNQLHASIKCNVYVGISC